MSKDESRESYKKQMKNQRKEAYCKYSSYTLLHLDRQRPKVLKLDYSHNVEEIVKNTLQI